MGLLAPHQADDVGHQVHQNLQRVSHSPWAAREIHDHRPSPHSCDSSRQRRERCPGKASTPDRLGDPGRLPLNHRIRRFGSNVPWTESGSSGGQDHVRLAGVGPTQKRLGDEVGLIRDDVMSRYPVPLLGAPLGDHPAAAILPVTARACITDREDREPDLDHLRIELSL